MTSVLGDEWVPGPDGIPFRKGARVLLLDAEGSLLLIEGHDGDDVDHRWWFTTGGGIGPEETPSAAAAREVFEETGFVLDPGSLVGPVALRSATFRFVNHTVRQDEEFFVVQLDVVRPPVHDGGWTPLERSVLDQAGWFTVEELRELQRSGAQLYPEELVDLLTSVHPRWDGHVRLLSEQPLQSEETV